LKTIFLQAMLYSTLPGRERGALIKKKINNDDRKKIPKVTILANKISTEMTFIKQLIDL
jgi:hypothetical protein